MKITVFDKIHLLFSMYSVLYLLPNFKKKISTLLRPVDNTRFFEFSYLKKFIKKNNLYNLSVLDISSPHMMAYYLSKNNYVLKTNIDIDEKKFIKENKNLKFKIEDATQLSFLDNTYDLVYSISVIEHIYKDYVNAILEMVRVTKKNGYIYLTFPVADEHTEDWLEEYIYSNQFSKDGKNFFFYRFSEFDCISMLEKLEGVNILHKDIFWEKRAGFVDSVFDKLNYKFKNKYFIFIKDIFFNNYYGFTMFSSNPVKCFSKGKKFGVMHLILKKN